MKIWQMILMAFLPMMITGDDGGGDGGGAGGDAGLANDGQRSDNLDNGNDGANADGGGAGGDDGADGSGDGGKGGGKPLTDAELQTGMLGEIAKGLKAAGAEGDDTATGGAGKDDDAANAGKTSEQIAADKAAADAEKQKQTDAALAKKKADDFQLSPEEKRVLGPKAQARFHELHRYAKIQEDRVRQVMPVVQQLTQARDEILAVFEEHQATPQDLIPLLQFNKLRKSGDIEGALRMIENTRLGLYKALGRAAPGVDLLDDFPDLKAKVDALEMTPDAAAEVATARRQAATLAARQQHEQRGQQHAQQQKEVVDGALAEISRWQAEAAVKDPQFAAKQKAIIEKIPEVIKSYAPNQWLATIKLLYENTAVPASAPTDTGLPPRGPAPIRPNGNRGGAKEATDMASAISSGLGYNY